MAKPIHLLVLLMGAGTTISAQTGQPADTIWRSKHYFGLVFSPLSFGVQFSPPPGGIAISVPYTVTDASGTTTSYVFNSAPKKVYHLARLQPLNFVLEYGQKRYYASTGMIECMEGGSFPGVQFVVGAGLNWYLHDPSAKRGSDAGILIQTGLNLVFNWDEFANRNAIVGGINDVNDTVHILGITAGPQFTVPTRGASPDIHASTHVDIAYGQDEVAIMPIVSITNHFLSRRGMPLRVDIGYSIPVQDNGFVYVIQDDGSSPGKGDFSETGGSVHLGNPAVSATYNGKPIRKAPYRLKGMYVAVSVWAVGNRSRRGRVGKSGG